MQAKYQHSNDTGDDAGLYTWDLETDTLYADSALARLFGIDKTLAEHGLPQATYLDRVFADDRPALAGAIREAILTGEPFQESYRVHGVDGRLVRVLALGRCFRDTKEEPRFYAGIVFPMPDTRSSDESLLWQCLAALEIAKREGRDDVASLLIEATRRLNGGDNVVTFRRTG